MDKDTKDVITIHFIDYITNTKAHNMYEEKVLCHHYSRNIFEYKNIQALFDFTI